MAYIVSGGADGNSATFTLAGVPAGATVIATIMSQNNTATSFGVSDNLNGAYTAVSGIVSQTTDNCSIQAFKMLNSASGTLTIAHSIAGDTVFGVTAAAYSNGDVNAFSFTAPTTSNATTTNGIVSASITPTVNGCAIYSFFQETNVATTPTITAGTSPNAYTSRRLSSFFTYSWLMQDFTQTTAAAITATATCASSTRTLNFIAALAPQGVVITSAPIPSGAKQVFVNTVYQQF